MITLVSSIFGVASDFVLPPLPLPGPLSLQFISEPLMSLPFLVAITIPRYPSMMYVMIFRMTPRYGTFIPAYI